MKQSALTGSTDAMDLALGEPLDLDELEEPDLSRDEFDGDGADGQTAEMYHDVHNRMATRNKRIQRCAGYEAYKVRRYLRQSGAQRLLDNFPRPPTAADPRPALEGEEWDMRNLGRFIGGDWTVERLRQVREPVYVGNQAVGLSVDMSGSMGSAEKPAKACVGAFAESVQRAGDEVVVNSFPGPRLVTSPFEEFEWQHLNAIYAGGGTPMAAGIEDCLDLLGHCRSSTKILIVLTDGRASRVDRCRELVDEAREADGISVIGIGFGSADRSSLEPTFGTDGFLNVGLGELPEALASAYYSQVAPREVGR